MAPSNSKLIAELMNNNTTINTEAIPNGSGVSIGTIVPFAGTSAPTGFLICDGSQISVTTYADLYTAIGTTWGTLTDGAGGAGSTHFRIPDLQNDFIRGKSGTRAVGLSEADADKTKTIRIWHGQEGSGQYQMPSGALNRTMVFNQQGDSWGPWPEYYGYHGMVNAGVESNTYNWQYRTLGEGDGTEVRPRNKTALYCIKF